MEDNDAKVQKDIEALLRTMADNSRRETESAIAHCVTDLTYRLPGAELLCANTEKEMGNLISKVDDMKVQQDKMQETLAELIQKLGTSASAPSFPVADRT